MLKKIKLNKRTEVNANRKIFYAKDISRIYFRKTNSRERIRLGSGNVGIIYEGTVIFKDKNGKNIRKKVAIKQFNNPEFLEDKKIRDKYRKIIKNLRNIKLEFDSRFLKRDISKSSLLPKMELAKIKTERRSNGEWVLVMSAFSKSGKSKFYKNNKFNIENMSEKELNLLAKEIAFINTKIGELGYNPTHFLAQLIYSKALIPLDLDLALFRDINKDNYSKSRIMFFSLKSIASLLSKDINKSYKILNKIYNYSLPLIKDKNLKKYYIQQKEEFKRNLLQK